MKKISYLLFALILISCSNQDKSVKVVKTFLTQFNEETNIDSTLLTPSFKEMLKANLSYINSNIDYTSKIVAVDTIMVDAKGYTTNALGRKVSINQAFMVIKDENKWKIDNSFKFMVLNLNFKVVDTNWDFYWDQKRNRILKEIQENTELIILKKGYRRFGDCRQGKIKFINNSDYDLKNITYRIEVLDKDGKSVATDTEYIRDIVRKNGYRMEEWYVSDCENGVKETLRILYQREAY